jgi:4a-hydroxytetrahydrobiopterin dehydratase
MNDASPATSSLAKQKCKACESGVGKLSDPEVKQLLREVPDWELRPGGKDGSGGEIARTFKFQNYYETLAFVNATAWVSHREDHHPDLEVATTSAPSATAPTPSAA